jgi:hypothetical protein
MSVLLRCCIYITSYKISCENIIEIFKKKSIVQIVESEDYMYWIQCFDFLILEYKVQNSCNDLSPVFLRVPVAEYVFSRFLL